MNPFSVLESDDEEETPKVVKTTKTANKKPQEKPAAPKAPAPAPVEEAAPVAEKSNPRGGGGRGRGGAGRGRGRGEKKGGKVPKHEFERHSANGRGKEVSKAGSGKGNWGNPKEEAEHAAKESIEEVVAADTPADEEENAPGQVVEEATPEPVEPETPTFTLDEYLAQRNNARANADIFGEFSVRTVDTNEFSGLKTKEESEDTFISLGGGKVAKKKEQNQRSAKSAVVLDVGFSVAPTETPRGEGRGRGRGRGEGRGARGEGRGARGEGRGGRGGRGGRKNSAENKVDINDSAAFPSL